MKKPRQYIEEITQWAVSIDAIRALALVGSHARNQARPDSDIDFLFLCEDKEVLLQDLSWISQFGKITSYSREEWGMVTSIRVFYQDGQEIEFGVAPIKWAHLPVDAGTQKVVSDGMIILKDINKLLENVRNSIKQKGGV